MIQSKGYAAWKALVLATVIAIAVRPILADNKAALTDRLKNAEVDTSLDDSKLAPWHLKLEIQYYDLKGKPTEKGTIEEWWAAPRQRVIAYTLPEYTGKYVQNSTGEFWSKAPGSPSYLANILLTQVVHPMPSDDKINQATPDLRKQSFGKVSLDCIMLTHPIKNVAYLPLGLYPTYCFDTGKDSLRATYSLGSMSIVRNMMGTFQGHSVPTAMRINEGANAAASAQIVELKGLHVDPTQFVPSNDMQPTGSMAMISGSVMAGTIMKKGAPVYPESARQRHMSGAVVLRALIGRDGRIQSLEIASTPDADLGLSALAAVQLWTYQPYLHNGEPIEVDTTITVHYDFGPR